MWLMYVHTTERENNAHGLAEKPFFSRVNNFSSSGAVTSDTEQLPHEGCIHSSRGARILEETAETRRAEPYFSSSALTLLCVVFRQ